MTNPNHKLDRRTFIKTGSAAAAAATAAASFIASKSHAAGNDKVKIGLIGCGGRGGGAAGQALNAASNVEIIGVADAFPDNAKNVIGTLKYYAKNKAQVNIPEDQIFHGFDAYKKLLALDIDVVVIATPPGFRPIHFAAAIEAGKHVFMEKPVAVDAPGVQQILKYAKIADEKNLKVGVGLQRHHENSYIETMKRVKDGAIGDIITMRAYWNSGGVWTRGRKSLEKKYGRKMSEMEYQMRNWYYFNWLCGDHINEQHIHNLDVCNWLKDDFPVEAKAHGGRQVRDGIDHGEIYDHHFVEYTYKDGTKMFSQCRHIQNCWNQVSEFADGSKGSAYMNGTINSKISGKWRFKNKDKNNAYQTEHDDLFSAIKNNKPYNEAYYGAKSTMTSILGRMASYSGKVIKWDAAINSQISLAPKSYDFNAEPPVLPNAQGRYAIPMPGKTVVI